MSVSVIDEFISSTEELFTSFKKEIAAVRTNRPQAALIEDLKVVYYEQFIPLKQLGSIGVTPPREIHVQVWDSAAVPAVVKAIETSSLGLSARADGMTVRIFLPELSEERREELARHVKRIAEQYRIRLRHARDEINKKIQKLFDEHDLNEDQKFKLKEEVQKRTEITNKNIEAAVEVKIKEINE